MDEGREDNRGVWQGRLELRAEQAVVEKQRVAAGSVVVRRELRHRTEQLTVELLSEVLVLEARPGAVGVTVDGVPLAPGETREITLSREEAHVEKRVAVTETVDIFKRRREVQRTLPVELAYEELDVQASEGLAVRQERGESEERGRERT